MVKPSDVESKIMKFIDSHIRLIQYSCYGLAFIGATFILRSIHTFSRFTSARDIPTEFISKGVCLQGRVTNVQLESPKISSLMMINGGQAYSPIRISVEHTPILNARRYLKQSPAPLHIELACIWCTSKGLEQLQELIKDQDIWFQIYGIQQDDNLLYSSILLKKTWRFWLERDVGLLLLKKGYGMVAPLKQQFNPNDLYLAYYHYLLLQETKFQGRKPRNFLKLPFFRSKSQGS